MEADLASSRCWSDSHCTRLLTVCQTRCSSWSDYQLVLESVCLTSSLAGLCLADMT
nr:MAG TPA: hypothetical protein [Caudoviricetes sp.]